MSDRIDRRRPTHPKPVITYATPGAMPGYPGVRFLQPHYATAGSWRVPVIVVDEAVLDSAYVLEAVLAYGREFRQVTVMRKAHKVWEREVLPARLRDAGIEMVNEAEHVARRAAL